ncbi:type I restriction enzyme endonuclease domain-containing protein [Sediminibacillus albus]|uniref:type I restriction enzyme endonuclease domain-containing protein n=1 Tax=Sediminibacillus albus TaxID=407036 RepID=UPI001FE11D4E|nr:type I restriction enzyme endonuclease domain-containing protein [Sediminibacillus albus]
MTKVVSYAVDLGIVPEDKDYDIDEGVIFDLYKEDYTDSVELKKMIRDILVNHTNTPPKIKNPYVTITYSLDDEPAYHVDLPVYLKSKYNNNLYLAWGKESLLTFDIEQAEGLFWGFLQDVRELIPQKLYPNNLSINEWRALPKVEREDFIAEVVNHFLGGEEKVFLESQVKLAKSHKLVSHLSSVTAVSGEVLLYDIVKTQLRKISQPIGGDGQNDNSYEKKLGQIVNESVSSYGSLDLFEIAGIEKPNISVLDDAFLAGLVEKPHIDLRMKLLRQLLEDEIKVKFKKKNPKGKQMSEMLNKTIEEYHNRVISAADVIRFMVEMRNNLDEETKRRMDLGLTEEEVAFYEIIANMENATFDNQFMAGLVHQVVKNMKKEFQVDWTNPHRQDILSKVNLAVKATLMKNKIKPEQLKFLTNAFVEEAKEQFKDWPIDS